MTTAHRITLTTARVRTLAETYGADISRWTLRSNIACQTEGP